MTRHRSLRTPRPRIFALLVGLALTACSDKAPPVEPTPLPTPLPPIVTGVVVGPPATATIGAGGGTLSLADGSASITVPAGALSRATELSIQSITNIAPNGIGNGVRIGPENLTFATPVTVTINYSASAADSSSPEGFGIARQDSTGAWMAFLESSVTPSARIANVSSASLRVTTAARAGGGAVSARTGRTGHYVPGRLWIFTPDEADVVTNGTVALSVVACHDEAQQMSQPGGSMAPMLRVCEPSIRVPTWSVNGIVRGNATIGEVAAGAQATATYRAPATVPSPSTVSVSVGLFWAARGVTKTFTSQITILEPDIKLNIVGTYLDTAWSVTSAPGELPSSIEDRFTLEIVMAGDLRSLKEYRLVENPVTAVTSGGGFQMDPTWCRPPVMTGPFDAFLVDTTRLPELVRSPRIGGGSYLLLRLKSVSLQPDVTYFISDLAAPNGCRVFPWPRPDIPRDSDIEFRIPSRGELPAPGSSETVDTRFNGSGWIWIIGRPARP